MDIHSLTGLAPLLAGRGGAEQGFKIGRTGWESKTAAKGASQMVYDLQLSNVQVTSLENDPGSQGVETQLAFSYKSGKLSDDVSSARPRRRPSRAAGRRRRGHASRDDDGALDEPSLHYYLKIDGLDGGLDGPGPSGKRGLVPGRQLRHRGDGADVQRRGARRADGLSSRRCRWIFIR